MNFLACVDAIATMPIEAVDAAKRIAEKNGVDIEKVVASYLGAAKNFVVNADSLFLG